jgi:hypothetical protein
MDEIENPFTDIEVASFGRQSSLLVGFLGYCKLLTIIEAQQQLVGRGTHKSTLTFQLHSRSSRDTIILPNRGTFTTFLSSPCSWLYDVYVRRAHADRALICH